MSIFLMTFSDSEKSEFWDTPMAHMVTCFGNYHFLPLFLSTYSIPRILLEFAPPLKNSKKWGFQPRRIFFNGRILCGSGDGGWSTTVCSGHIWEALRCPFANYVLQKCVTVTDDHDAMDVYSLPLVGCFFFWNWKGYDGHEMEMNLFLGLFWWVSIEVKDAPRNTLEDFGKIEDSISKSHLKTCSVVATVSLLGEMNCNVPILVGKMPSTFSAACGHGFFFGPSDLRLDTSNDIWVDQVLSRENLNFIFVELKQKGEFNQRRDPRRRKR